MVTKGHKLKLILSPSRKSTVKPLRSYNYVTFLRQSTEKQLFQLYTKPSSHIPWCISTRMDSSSHYSEGTWFGGQHHTTGLPGVPECQACYTSLSHPASNTGSTTTKSRSLRLVSTSFPSAKALSSTTEKPANLI